MNAHRSLVVVCCFFFAVTVSATTSRTFVSTHGSDSNPCTPGLECRTINYALTQTSAGGEVIAIDSGGYGPFSVSQSVTVEAAPGVIASAVTSATTGINVSGGSNVVLRGLTITLTGSGYGIYAIGFGNLLIDHCTISGGDMAIYIGGAATSHTTIADTVASHATQGILTTSPTTIVRSRAEFNSSVGFYVWSTALLNVTVITDSVSTHNATGVYIFATVGGSAAHAIIDRSDISNNSGDGVNANALTGAVAAAWLTHTTVAANGGYGLHQQNVGAITTTGSNLVAANSGGDTGGTISTIPLI